RTAPLPLHAALPISARERRLGRARRVREAARQNETRSIAVAGARADGPPAARRSERRGCGPGQGERARIVDGNVAADLMAALTEDRKSTRLNSSHVK